MKKSMILTSSKFQKLLNPPSFHHISFDFIQNLYLLTKKQNAEVKNRFPPPSVLSLTQLVSYLVCWFQINKQKNEQKVIFLLKKTYFKKLYIVLNQEISLFFSFFGKKKSGEKLEKITEIVAINRKKRKICSFE